MSDFFRKVKKLDKDNIEGVLDVLHNAGKLISTLSNTAFMLNHALIGKPGITKSYTDNYGQIIDKMMSSCERIQKLQTRAEASSISDNVIQSQEVSAVKVR